MNARPVLFSVRALSALFVIVQSLVAQGAGTALVRHAPTLNGTVDGSLQQLLPEATTLNGNAAFSGDLLVPGRPTVRLNGSPSYGGTIDGTGSAAPASYQITLNGGAALRHVVRRTDPVALAVVPPPPAPTGTRSVTLNGAGQSAGDFATLKNLTLNGNVGPVAIPPGSYGDFTANGGSGFALGIAGAAQPAIYNFQRLTLNGQSQFQVVGPVIVTLANGMNANGHLGAINQPAWLTLNFASGGLTLNGSVNVYGYVNAPAGTITINGGSQLVGGLAADRLTLNGNGRLRLVAAQSNQPPTVALIAPPNGASYVAPAAITLQATASDSDGSVAKVEFYRGTTKLGEAGAAPFTLALANLAAGSYAFTARAIDNRGATADSSAVAVTVAGNQPPAVSITSPAGGAAFVAPATFGVVAAANDADGAVTKVEFLVGATKIGEDLVAPFEATASGLAAGTHAITARATDNLGASTVSAAVTVTVQVPNQPPTVGLTAPPAGSVFPAPASFALVATATDADGTIARVEFFQGGAKLGEGAVSPYHWALSGLGAGNYLFTARAYDNAGAATDSAALPIVVNQAPTVALISPAEGAVFTAPASILLSASANDADGTVARVEFFSGATKIGEAAAIPFQFTWPGVAAGEFALTARAIDNHGATAISTPRNITVRSPVLALPYFTGFEPTDGYVAGPLGGQLGWTAIGGGAIAASGSYRGAQMLALPGAEPVATAEHAVAAVTGQSVVFVEVFAKPMAAATAAAGAFVRTGASRVALVQAGAVGELHVFDGDGSGGGAWKATGSTVPLATGGQASAWLRLTLREDFAAKRFDLFADGRLIAFDVGFVDQAVPAFAQIAFAGPATGATTFDDLFIGFDNPLFTDADKDGMDDAWEVANGLNPAINDRATDVDGDGRTAVREYAEQTSPSDFFNGVPPVLVVISGDAQSAPAGQFAPQPLVLELRSGGGVPLANAPVAFAVTSGGGLLASVGTPGTLVTALALRTGADGRASVLYRQPSSEGVLGTITATAGGVQAVFHSTSAAERTLDTLYAAGFEATEGFALGPLADQQGWFVGSGVAAIVADVAKSGERSLSVKSEPGSTFAFFQRDFDSDPAKPVVFVDFWARPFAGEPDSIGTFFWTEAMQFGVHKVGDHGEVYFSDGDGLIGTGYQSTGVSLPLGADDRVNRWVRFTVRIDYAHTVWDLYVDGQAVTRAISLDASADRLLFFGATLVGESAFGVDAFYAGYDNPLFADADRDGMEDIWEIAHQLDGAADDGALDPDHDGLNNMGEFVHGTDPHGADSDSDGIPDGWETRHGLDPKNPADAALDRDGDGIANLQEFQNDDTDTDGDGIADRNELTNGTDPNDFFNGITPQIVSLVGPNGELGPGGALSVRVTAPDGTPLPNAPATFAAKEGGHFFATTPGGPGSGVLEVRADGTGVATVYVVEGN